MVKSNGGYTTENTCTPSRLGLSALGSSLASPSAITFAGRRGSCTGGRGDHRGWGVRDSSLTRDSGHTFVGLTMFNRLTREDKRTTNNDQEMVHSGSVLWENPLHHFSHGSHLPRSPPPWWRQQLAVFKAPFRNRHAQHEAPKRGSEICQSRHQMTNYIVRNQLIYLLHQSADHFIKLI